MAAGGTSLLIIDGISGDPGGPRGRGTLTDSINDSISNIHHVTVRSFFYQRAVIRHPLLIN